MKQINDVIEHRMEGVPEAFYEYLGVEVQKDLLGVQDELRDRFSEGFTGMWTVAAVFEGRLE